MNQNHAPFFQTVYVDGDGLAMAAPPGKIPNFPTPEGRELGERLADMVDDEARQNQDAPLRCSTCAFRKGTMPNGSEATLCDAIKCVVEKDVTFDCHERPGVPCAGAALLAKRMETVPGIKIPWGYSND